MDRINSFAPIIDKQSKILILGSVPGVKSLQVQEYYAHPQNKFWRIIFELFDVDFTTNYSEKINLIKTKNIALWDVIESCERKGSKDVDIKNELTNNINSLIENYPNIKAIFCNGKKSYHSLKKQLPKDTAIPVFVLPSTSPLHTISYDEKLISWLKILDFLKD